MVRLAGDGWGMAAFGLALAGDRSMIWFLWAPSLVEVTVKRDLLKTRRLIFWMEENYNYRT